MRSLPLIFVCASAALAQIGSPYPYPNPRGGSPVPGIPMPRRKSKTTTEKTPPKVLPQFSGNLQRMDGKAIVLEMDDFRVLEFRRNDKTKFFKNGEDAKPEIFKPGDRVSIEGEQDAEAFLTAVNVHWEKAGTGKVTKKEDDGPTEEQIAAAEKARDEADRKQASAATPPVKDAIPAPEKPATEAAPPPAPRDPDDPGPPRIQRGKPAPRPRAVEREPEPEPIPAQRPAQVETAANNNPLPMPGTPATVERIDTSLPQTSGDAFIRKAQETALEFTETLPNYYCQEVIARYYSETNPVNWRPLDVVSMALVYENGKENYRDISVNGKATKKSIEEVGGSWSTGEFGTVLVDIFSPATAADFRYRRQARIAGIDTRMYDFTVDRENSHWTIHSGAQTYRPAYSGSVWIDPKTNRVLRIEMQSRNMPQDFPVDKVESATDYEYVRLGGTQQFLLPVHAETLSCQRGTARCSRNAIDFRNYHKYSGESSIQFGSTK